MKKVGDKSCFFCKKKGHMKKDCLKYKKWLEKKGNLIFVCYESNFTEVLNNTWWIDCGSTIHVAKTIQGFLHLRKPKGNEQRIYSRNRLHSDVEGVGTYRLILKTGFQLDLENTFYVPFYSRNLISFAILLWDMIPTLILIL